MYAVIKTGGKQFRVVTGEKIKVEQFAADVGQEIVFDQVLAVGNGSELKVGTPLVSGATVTVTVLSHGLFDKVHIFKMRRRKHYQKRQGHRQQYTELQIGAIDGSLIKFIDEKEYKLSWHKKKAAALREMVVIPSQKCLA